MSTKIYISRKLESVLPKGLISSQKNDFDNPLGKWNAALFYVSGKKCLMLTNSTARYSVLMDNMTKDDFANFSGTFIKNLYNQLLTDKIEVDIKFVIKVVGLVDLYTTDNDRTILGTQNSILENLDFWKHEFGQIENWQFREINRRINEVVYKQNDWLTPKAKMKIEIEKLNTNA